MAVWATWPGWESCVWTTTASLVSPEASQRWNTSRWVRWVQTPDTECFTLMFNSPSVLQLWFFYRWCTCIPTTSTGWMWMISALKDLGWRGRSITALACSQTLSTTGRCSLRRSAVWAIGWPFSSATTKSKDREMLRDGESEGKVVEEEQII